MLPAFKQTFRLHSWLVFQKHRDEDSNFDFIWSSLKHSKVKQKFHVASYSTLLQNRQTRMWTERKSPHHFLTYWIIIARTLCNPRFMICATHAKATPMRLHCSCSASALCGLLTMISSSERALLFLFIFNIFNDLRYFFHLFSSVCADFFNIFTAMWRSLIFEWISNVWCVTRTHLTKSTKIPPTKITSPISGTMLEIDEAVNTTELITFILKFYFFSFVSFFTLELILFDFWLIFFPPIFLFLQIIFFISKLFDHSQDDIFQIFCLITHETGFQRKRSLVFWTAKSEMSWRRLLVWENRILENVLSGFKRDDDLVMMKIRDRRAWFYDVYIWYI